MRIRESYKVEGKHKNSWEWIILGNREVRGKVHRAKIDWVGQRNYSPPRPIIMAFGHFGRLLADSSSFWVVEEISDDERDIICELCREEHSNYKHAGHRLSWLKRRNLQIKELENEKA